jgi:hypothetical protein
MEMAYLIQGNSREPGWGNTGRGAFAGRRQTGGSRLRFHGVTNYRHRIVGKRAGSVRKEEINLHKSIEIAWMGGDNQWFASDVTPIGVRPDAIPR